MRRRVAAADASKIKQCLRRRMTARVMMLCFVLTSEVRDDVNVGGIFVEIY